MADRFFSKADELRAVVASASNDVDFCNLVDQLQIEFAMLNDEFRLMEDEERNKPRHQDVEINAKHTFFAVGLNLVERSLEINLTPTVPCGQRLNDPQSDEQQKEQTQSMQIDQDTVDPENASVPQATASTSNAQQGNGEMQMPLQLSYQDFVLLVKPIYKFRKMQAPSVQDCRLLIEAINEVQVRADELNYNLESDERALVAYIHGIMDDTTRELWEWHVFDKGVATLPAIIHFLKVRIQRMPKPATRPSSAASSNWDEPSTSAGISNPPKRAKQTDGCYQCGLGHGLCKCPTFDSWSLQAKSKFVHNKKLCINCFSPEHMVAACPLGPCKKCKPIKHNSKLCPKNQSNF